MKYRVLFYIFMTATIGCSEVIAQHNWGQSATSIINVLSLLPDSLNRSVMLSGDSLTSDSLSVFSSLAEEFIVNQVNRVASDEWSLARQWLEESPEEKLMKISGFNAVDLSQAINHFSGKDEMLKQGIQAISDLQAQKENFLKKWIRSDSSLRSPRSISITLSMGMVRPFPASLAAEVYPSIGLASGSGITILCGWTQRIGYGKYYGGRLAFDYSWKHGLSLWTELEHLVQEQEGFMIRRNHLVTGIKKSVRLSDRAQSFVLSLIDWGRQLPDDGYAERYRIRIGIAYQLWKK